MHITDNLENEISQVLRFIHSSKKSFDRVRLLQGLLDGKLSLYRFDGFPFRMELCKQWHLGDKASSFYWLSKERSIAASERGLFEISLSKKTDEKAQLFNMPFLSKIL